MNIGIEQLIGKTLKECMTNNYDSIKFITENDEYYSMHHDQDCCESVIIEDIVGDLQDLVGTPILEAREDSNFESEGDGKQEWTFYNFRTIKGSVTIRWFGSSNGYYSTAVNFRRIY